jgi:hypothetical protein
MKIVKEDGKAYVGIEVSGRDDEATMLGLLLQRYREILKAGMGNSLLDNQFRDPTKRLFTLALGEEVSTVTRFYSDYVDCLRNQYDEAIFEADQ